MGARPKEGNLEMTLFILSIVFCFIVLLAVVAKFIDLVVDLATEERD